MNSLERVASAINNVARALNLLYQHTQINHGEILTELYKMEYRIMSDNQAHIDQLASQFKTALDNIQTEITNLKNQPGAENLDFSALDAEANQAAGMTSAPSQPNQPSEPTQPEEPTPVEEVPASEA